jgi:hypothetical protein
LAAAALTATSCLQVLQVRSRHCRHPGSLQQNKSSTNPALLLLLLHRALHPTLMQVLQFVPDIAAVFIARNPQPILPCFLLLLPQCASPHPTAGAAGGTRFRRHPGSLHHSV